MCLYPKNYFTDKNGTVAHNLAAEKSAVKHGQHGCGQCYECRALDRNQKTIRGSMEATQYESNLYITLTYSPEFLPPGGSLVKADVQKFMKRLKKYCGSTKDNPIRQIYAGEYGDDGRPHYHLIIFNLSLPDFVFHRLSDDGFPVFRSPTLEKLWPFGFSEFTNAAPANIAYVYKYIIKKKSKKYRKDLVDHDTGLILEHEFVEGSRNPGIGAFLRDSQTIRKGYIVYNNQTYPLPLYYKKHLVKTKQFQVMTQIEGNSLDNNSNSSKPNDKTRAEYYRLLTERPK